MKIDELRSTIKSHKRDSLEYLIAELYKLVPNAKKDDYQIDELIKQGKPKKGAEKPSKKITVRSIQDINVELDKFIENAMAFYYSEPNKVVAKKDRPKWRFVVKRLYNEILAAETHGNEPGVCAQALVKLYKLLTYACHYILFNGYDVFDSIGIGQNDFFTSITILQRKSLTGKEFVKQASELAINNPLNRYTLYSGLMDIVIEQCPTPDMQRALHEYLHVFYSGAYNAPGDKNDRAYNKQLFGYKKRNKLNTIAEAILEICCVMDEFDKGIAEFNEKYSEQEPEIRLYVLIRILFRHNKPQLILKQINDNLTIKPRKSLMNLRDHIQQNNALPQYFI